MPMASRRQIAPTSVAKAACDLAWCDDPVIAALQSFDSVLQLQFRRGPLSG
jgi:hypothetical protein